MTENYQNKINTVNSALVNAHNHIALNKNNPSDYEPVEQIKQTQEINKEKVQLINSSRLNDLDSTLLENEAYQEIDDDNFKTEYRINLLEKKIKSIDTDINNAKSINDYQKVDILVMRKHALQNELKNLYSTYENADITTKLSDDITKILSTKPTYLIKIVSEIRNFICNNILSKISKSFNRNQDVKIALSKLTTLNKNVDELITMQTPYGEADEWYDKLSDYLNTANVIHFQISKTVGTPTFFDTISSLDKQKIGAKRKNSSNFNNMANKPK